MLPNQFSGAQMGFAERIPLNLDYLIEPTAAVIAEALAMPGDMTVMAFFQQILLPRAVNKNGEHFVCFIDVNDILHFHSLRYNPALANDSISTARGLQNAVMPAYHANGTVGFQWKYLSGADFTGDCLNFTPTDNSLQAGQLGGADMTVVAYDSNRGLGLEMKSTIEQGPTQLPPSTAGSNAYGAAGTNTLDEVAAANTRLNGINNDQHYHHIKSRESLEINSMISNAVSRPRMQLMAARAEVIGNHRIAVNDYIEIRAFDYEHFDIYLGGIFQVISVVHNVDSRGWITTYDMIRQGQPYVSSGTQILKPNAAAQGSGGAGGGTGAYTIVYVSVITSNATTDYRIKCHHVRYT